MTPDIFICTAPASQIRQKMYELTIHYWRWMGYNPVTIGCLAKDRPMFEIDRRKIAESLAKTDIYILSDDDCLPIFQQNWLEGALEVVSRHPQFGTLSAYPDNEFVTPYTSSPPYEVIHNEEVMEHINVGGVRFMRRGLSTNWDKYPFNGRDYDASHAGMLKDKGYRVGYLKHFRMTHLGKGYSEIWEPERWVGETPNSEQDL